MRPSLFAALSCSLLLAMSAGGQVRAQEAPVVAAAADLRFALAEVAEAFARDSQREVRLTFGSSGDFSRQIRQGAPFQMFLSADEQFVLDLATTGFTVDDGLLYAVGHLAIMVPTGSPLKADGTLADLKAALDDGRLKKFAIANPEHAPYGRRAEEALRQAGVWEAIADRLVFGENAAQAAQFAIGGDTQGGIVAYSLALSPSVSKRGSYALIPAAWHRPLRQRMALVKGAGETARLFYRFMQTPSARVIMGRYGFALPGESS